MSNEWIQELISAIEKQYGKIEYFTVCSSFEDSPEFKRIAGIGYTTPCEIEGCSQISVNCCCFCTKALCMEHSHDTISEEGHEAHACAYCMETV